MKARTCILGGVAVLVIGFTLFWICADLGKSKYIVRQTSASAKIKTPPRKVARPPREGGRTRLSQRVGTRTLPPANCRETPFAPTLSADEFSVLLSATTNESLEVRAKAWRAMDELERPEKIHWLGHFAKSGDESMRATALRATRKFFSTETFARKTKTTYKDMKARRVQATSDGRAKPGGRVSSRAAAGADALPPDDRIEVDFSELPTKREAVQINNIVRNALKDESGMVRDEAILTASSFDIGTANMIYQYAMTSCGDDVRLAVLREAEYGDDDFKLRLQMAALDVGGEEVVKVAAEGIEKATGRRFANSKEAFDWYENNMASDDGMVEQAAEKDSE